MNALLPAIAQYLGAEGEDPTAPFWASGNYVGPYWSDGAVQESVEWGDKPALNELDHLARQHDAAYAHYQDAKHREAADMLFAREADKLKGKYGPKLADDPRFAAAMVKYGNYAGRKASKLPEYLAMGGLGVLKYGYDHVKEMTQRIDGTYLNKEMSDILRFQSTDPRVGSPTGPLGKGPGARVEATSSKTTTKSNPNQAELKKTPDAVATQSTNLNQPNLPGARRAPKRKLKKKRKSVSKRQNK